MVNHKLKLIYARVACTASCTLKGTLEKQNVSFESVDTAAWIHDPLHVSLKYICENIAHHDEYFKFTVIRNPYDRLVSAFHFYHDWYTFTYHNTLDMSFSRFVENLYYSADWRSERVKYTDQHAFVDGCDYIGRFEDLRTSYLELCEHIDITPIPFVVTNHVDHWGYIKSPRSHEKYQDYYDNNTKQLVTEMCDKDIITYQYQF